MTTTDLLGQIKNNLAAGIMHSLHYLITQVVGHDEKVQKDIRASKIIVERAIPENIEELVIASSLGAGQTARCRLLLP